MSGNTFEDSAAVAYGRGEALQQCGGLERVGRGGPLTDAYESTVEAAAMEHPPTPARGRVSVLPS